MFQSFGMTRLISPPIRSDAIANAGKEEKTDLSDFAVNLSFAFKPYGREI